MACRCDGYDDDNNKKIKDQEIACARCLTSHLVRDDGLTEIEPGTVTGLAIGPHSDETFVGLTDHLPLG